MRTPILNLIKTDHEIFKQWSYGITDVKLHPVISRIELPKNNSKKIVFVLPSFLSKFKIKETVKDTLVLILKNKMMVTMFYCDHPNYLFKKEKEVEFQMIY